MIKSSGSEESWFDKVLSKFDEVKKAGIKKMSNIECLNYSDDMNLAMEHCCLIFLAMIEGSN